MGSQVQEDGRFASFDQTTQSGGEILASFEFPRVDPSEMGYALTFFVAAGNRRLGSGSLALREGEFASNQACMRLFNMFVPSAAPAQKEQRQSAPGESSLAEAFWRLWQQFEGDSRQASLCGRVLAFYLLMESSQGSVVDAWTEADAEEPGLISLQPVVVEALSSVPLGPQGQLQEATLVAAIEGLHTR